MDSKDLKKTIILAVGAVVVFVGAVWFFKRWRQNFSFGSSLETLIKSQDMHYKPGFLPSYQGLYFQGMPPSLRVENDYHGYMLSPKDEGGCGGDYGNFECRQKAYLKAMKAGSTDKADLICYRHRNNEDDYYACLDSVYGNYIWMDRFAGVDTCVCPDGGTGTRDPDGSCFCPEDRPLHDRRLVDRNDEIVDRVGY